MKPTFILISLYILFVNNGYAQKGKNGAQTININNTVVNEYAVLTADANAGTTSIIVSNNSLNGNARFSSPLSTGDLILIIQMQGASINGSIDDSTWGAIINYNNCGLNEWAQVTGIAGSTIINLQCPLQNNYTATGKVQIVRVPRYTSLTVNAGDTLTCDAWNGSTGGILATEVSGNTLINSGGVIDVSGKGFRGGEVQNQTVWVWDVFSYASLTEDTGGMKGESIAGYENDYTKYGGMYGMGAPANGGGGGNSTNAPGGGGANGGNINHWTGNGNPDTSNLSWIAAWNLEYSGFAKSTSAGGGRGGYGCSTQYENPLTLPPGNPAWGSVPWAYRDNIGGKGGRPLDYSTGRLFLGGGGGAGQENDNYGGSGGNAGGLIYLLCHGTISGGGTISSNGQNGQNEISNFVDGDGAGGGGSGGTVILNSSGNITGISIDANGGNGGNQIITNSPEEAEGGGGSGGGGYIAISGGSIARQAVGGKNGTTTSASIAAFPPNGATKGGEGLPDELVTPVSLSSLSIKPGPLVTICNGRSVALHEIDGDSSVITYRWEPSSGLSNTNTPYTIASPSITTTYTLTATGTSCPGTDSVVVSVVPKVVIDPLADTSICSGASVLLNLGGLPSYHYSWGPSSGLNCDNCQNPLANPFTSTTYTLTATNNYCSDTGLMIININRRTSGDIITAIPDTICQGASGKLVLSNNSIDSIQWQSSGTGSFFTNINGAVDTTKYTTNPLTESTYYRAIVKNAGCTGISDTLELIVQPPLIALFTYSGGSNTVIFNSGGSKGNIVSYYWDFGDGLTSGSANPTHTFAKDTIYYVCLTIYDGTNCSYTYCGNVDTKLLSGVASVAASGHWIIYPNPFISELIIDNKGAGKYIQSVEMYDVLGRLIITAFPDAVNAPVRLNVSGLAKDMYYIKVRTPDEIYVQKVVKQ